MPINAEWHRAHPMPRNPSPSQRLAWHVEHAKFCACRPMPPSLQALVAATPDPAPTSPTRPLRDYLSGGDRRSIAQSKDALAEVVAQPERVAELAALTDDADPLVAMRALDLLEKLAHVHTDWVQPHKRVFIGPLADSDRWELRLQVVRALPLLTWTARERRRVLAILTRDVEHPRTFVRAWALDGLATLAQSDASLVPTVEHHLRAFERSGRKALVARARAIRERVERRSRA